MESKSPVKCSNPCHKSVHNFRKKVRWIANRNTKEKLSVTEKNLCAICRTVILNNKCKTESGVSIGNREADDANRYNLCIDKSNLSIGINVETIRTRNVKRKCRRKMNAIEHVMRNADSKEKVIMSDWSNDCVEISMLKNHVLLSFVEDFILQHVKQTSIIKVKENGERYIFQCFFFL